MEKLSKKFTKKTNITFTTLTPLDFIEDDTVKSYCDALNFALKQDDIHNIAITGNYGSGKSTFINSYLKKEGTKKFIKISLATFASNKQLTMEKSSTEIYNQQIQEIEKSILQQMLYKKSGNSFPFSRFTRINKKNILLHEIIFIFSFLTIITIANPFWFHPLVDYIKKLNTPFETIFNVLFIIGISASIYIGYYITRFILRIKLTKFSFEKTEFGLVDIANESLLNRYIDEILYFFESTKYNIVIFEDLDRFENSEIFFNLREINTIINNYEKITNKVVFIYALRDDIFPNVNRTKFFDFIIPIVPIIDCRNSKDILLKRHNEFPKVNIKFLQEIGPYVDDMRLLTNCINEFKIYDSIINGGNKTNLFALIIYKNLYPKDFSDLTHKKGYIPQIFEEIRKIQAKKSQIKEIINYTLENEPEIYKNLIEFLLTNEYITENYIYHISRFYTGKIENKRDENFVKLVNEDKKPNFTLKLIDFENIIFQISEDKWSNNAILNNDLLCFLLKNEKDYYAEQIQKFIKTMYLYDKDRFENRFFRQYKDTSDCKFFDQHINKFIHSNKDYEYEVFFDKSNYDRLVKFFINIDDEQSEKYKNFISKEIKFLEKVDSIEELEIIINKLKQMNIKIDLVLFADKKNLLDLLIGANLYKITSNNLEKVLKKDSLYLTKLLEYNKNCNDYVMDDINEVIKEIQKIDSLKKEDVFLFEKILNNKYITTENKKKLIKENKICISDISKLDNIDDELMFYLFKYNKVKPTWKNIKIYFEKIHNKAISSELLDYIKINKQQLLNEKIEYEHFLSICDKYDKQDIENSLYEKGNNSRNDKIILSVKETSM